MAFSHLAGVTDPLAVDEIIDWFATFEAWIVSVGWTVVAGAGTTDLVLSSVGEAAGYTKLFVHVRRDGGFPNRVRGDVRDDAIGTNQTTCLGYVDSGGVQFAYWMSADLDAITIVFKTGVAYRMIYLGCLMPFALAPVDETYYMVATNGLLSSAILRQHNGLWDQNITNYHDPKADNVIPSTIDGAFPLFALIANDNDEIAGEFRHITAEIGLVPVVPEDTITTGYPGATCDWIVLSHTADKFALMTGGAVPVGLPDGASFAFQSGLTANQVNFITIDLAGFLTGIGWTDLGAVAGVPGTSRLFYSQGESGTEDIYCGVSWNANWFVIFVQDDAIGTHRTTLQNYAQMNVGWFPANYYISGDLDCFVFACENVIPRWDACWLGLAVPFNANLPNTTYNVCTRGRAWSYVLRGHDDVWSKQCIWNYGGVMMTASQPSLFDGTTYFVWPTFLDYGIGGALFEGVAMLKYLLFTSGGGIAMADTITVGPQVYTVFVEQANTYLAIRTT